ncbi:MAG TPA: phosphoribosylanthranilate isomerase [Thermoplasmata archaeon]
MRVKICGLTSLADAAMCDELGADALGFVHVPGRTRSLPIERISGIISSLGPLTTKVLVCKPNSKPEAEEFFAASGADILQLHSLGPDDLDSLRSGGIPLIRAVPPLRTEAERFANHAEALLFESGDAGTGTSYDYSDVPTNACRRYIIAGGLTPMNVAKAISMNPYAVDVSSGVERVAGSKDRELVRDFIRRCKQ